MSISPPVSSPTRPSSGTTPSLPPPAALTGLPTPLPSPEMHSGAPQTPAAKVYKFHYNGRTSTAVVHPNAGPNPSDTTVFKFKYGANTTAAHHSLAEVTKAQHQRVQRRLRNIKDGRLYKFKYRDTTHSVYHPGGRGRYPVDRDRLPPKSFRSVENRRTRIHSYHVDSGRRKAKKPTSSREKRRRDDNGDEPRSEE